jgi:hypothetical protein
MEQAAELSLLSAILSVWILPDVMLLFYLLGELQQYHHSQLCLMFGYGLTIAAISLHSAFFNIYCMLIVSFLDPV